MGFRTAASFWGITSLAVGVLAPGVANADQDAALRHVVDQEIQYANRSLARGDDVSTVVAETVDKLIDLAAFSDKIFGRYSRKVLSDHERLVSQDEFNAFVRRKHAQLLEAFRDRLLSDVVEHARSLALRRLRVLEADARGKEGKVTVLAAGSGPDSLQLELYLRKEEDEWRVWDASVQGMRASKHYHSLVANILKKRYSHGVLIAALTEQDFVVLEDFSTSLLDTMPDGWRWRPKHNDSPKDYRVVDNGKKRYLVARDAGQSVPIMTSAKWNPFEHPILTWCWRVDALPPGGDERYNDTNDSAAGVYVTYSEHWFTHLPKHNKFVWSSTLLEGTSGRRDMIARPYFHVVESGSTNKGRWVFEAVDVLESYRSTYGGDPDDRTVGIGVLTDANSTSSVAKAAYADFRVWPREAMESGRVEDYCDCLSEADAP